MSIYRGETFDVPLTFTDENGDELDLTGWSALLEIRPKLNSNTLYARLSTDPYVGGLTVAPDEAAGVLRIRIESIYTADFSWTTGEYDLRVTYANGDIDVPIRGKVSVGGRVSVL